MQSPFKPGALHFGFIYLTGAGRFPQMTG